MIGEYEREDAAEAVRARRARTLALLETIAEGAWEAAVTPGWRVREVAAHLVATDEAGLTGRMLALGLRPVPVDELERWNDEQVGRWAERPVPALLHGLDRWGRRVARVIATAPATLRLPGPFGRVSAPWLGMMRVYDEWIHLEDVRRTLGLPSDDAPEAVAPAARHLPAVMSLQTLPRIPASATGSVRLVASGVDGCDVTIDMDERRYGEGLQAEATVTAPAARLVMIAAGRDPWRDAEAHGILRIEGARGPAEVLLDALLAV